MQTSYDILGVPRNASNETIKAAFRKAAKAYHPDLNAGDPTREQQFKQVIAAYELLRNPRQRLAYDQGLASYERYLRSFRRKRIWRFAAVPVAALVSGAAVALGVSLSAGPPAAPSPTGGKIAQRVSHEVASVHERDGSRPAANGAEARAPLVTEWAEDVSMLEAPRVAITDAMAEREEEALRARSSTSLEERAAGFISAQVSGWSSASASDLASFANAYAEQVLYYGSVKSRQAVLLDKRSLLERWPKRSYDVQPDSMTIKCTANACKVSGLIDWQARSARRAASASGTARFEYQIILSDGAFSILGEKSSVVRPPRPGY
jgi:hypothetical protein